MEERRISRLYLTMFWHKLLNLFRGEWLSDLSRTGMFPAIILILLVLGLTVAYLESGRGNLSKIKSHIETPAAGVAPPAVYRPGGQDPVVLSRTRLAGSPLPEFVSAMFLPGRGMNVFQITAYLPDKGEINLLDSPSLESVSGLLSGNDAAGRQSLLLGGPFEAPWADRISGAASQTNETVTFSWHGHIINLPRVSGSDTGSAAANGLLLARAADSSGATVMPDGGQARASFHREDFGTHWPSKTDLTMTMLMSNRSIEITIVAQNVGDAVEPFGVGWIPRFALQPASRDQIKLKMPSQTRIETKDGGPPTGRLVPVAGTRFNFTERSGTPLGKFALDDTYVQLHPDTIGSGPAAELRFPDNNYGLRITALSPTIKAMHVVAPVDGKYISISPQFNYDDPFGREWPRETETGMVSLKPGESVQWKVRLEIFALSKPFGSM